LAMTVAAATRDAVRARPFLLDALRAGVVNYTAAARYLDVGDEAAVAAALRRFAEELPAYAHPATGRSVRVSMESGFGEGAPDDALLVVGDTALVPDAGDLTALLARGDVTPAVFRTMLGRLATGDVEVGAAGLGADLCCVAVPRADGPDALRLVEGATEAP
jgi:hypothetical protein